MRKIVILLIGIVSIGCTEISYKEPQPKGVKPLNELPSKLHGKYLMDNDTVYLFDKGLRGYEDGKKEFVLLSDTIVFKEYKGNYFFSYRDGDVWLLRILRQEKNGDISFLSMDDVPDNEAQRKIFLEKSHVSRVVFIRKVDFRGKKSQNSTGRQ